MKTILRIIILSLLLYAMGCSKKDNQEVTIKTLKSDAKALTSFSFIATDNTVLNENVTATLTEASKTVSASVPNGTDISALTPVIEISAKASISPTGTQDFRTPVKYTVTAEDGSSSTYSANIMIATSDAKQIVSFIFSADTNDAITEDVAGEIDETEKTIAVTLPMGTNITALTPTLEIPENASVDPIGAQDFSSPVTYTVTAEDGTTASYRVSLTVSQSSERSLISFAFLKIDNGIDENIVGEVDNESKKVFVVTKANTDLSALLPKLQISEGASYSPQGVQDFTEPVTYYIIAADGTQSNITVTVKTERDLLIAIDEANPNNNLDWDLTFHDLSADIRVQMNDSGYIYLLCLSEANLSVLPDEMGYFKNLNYLNLDKNQLSELPKSFGNLTNLLGLDLKDNNLQNLPSEILQLSNLYFLNLGENQFAEIPEEVYSLNLEELWFSGNQLKELPAKIGSLTSLTGIDLSSNLLSDLPEELMLIPNLEGINVANNIFEEIPNFIYTINSLTGISFAENTINKVSVDIVALDNLKYLILHDNLISYLPPEIGSIQSLELLNIQGNPIEILHEDICARDDIEIEKDDSTICK